MILTGDLIIESAKRGISFPSNNANSLSDDDILAFAYEEMVSKISPLITSLRQEYLIAPPYTITLDDDTQRYRMPQRALGRTLRNVVYVDAGGNRRDLLQVTPEESVKYMPTATSSGPVQAYYIENDYLVVLPIPSGETGAYLEVTYPLRPSQIIKVQDSGVISTATPATSTIVLVTALATITTSTAIDIISATSGNIVKTLSITPTNVASDTLTFAADAFGDDVLAGDYLCLAEQSPVVPIPEEALVALARATQNRILEAVDDLEALAVGERILYGDGKKKGLLDALAELLTPRVESKPAVAKGAANKYFLQSKSGSYFPRIRI